MYKIQEFLFSMRLIEKKEWGIILIGAIITTPIGGIVLLIFYWIKAYRKYQNQS